MTKKQRHEYYAEDDLLDSFQWMMEDRILFAKPAWSEAAKARLQAHNNLLLAVAGMRLVEKFYGKVS